MPIDYSRDDFRVIVAGSRTIDDYDFVKKKLDILLKRKKNVVIICGMARGADQLGERYAKENDLEIEYYPADWDKYGKSAGYIRNKQMARNADALIAFWDGVSKGTKNMIEIARKDDLPIRTCLMEIKEEEEDNDEQ